ncbi:MAG: nucleotidyltransferase family protein [Candidatus Diapherotrites archaeon]
MDVPEKAFILAGGKGERLRPLTADRPKPMLPVKGKPILEWGIRHLADFGVKEVVLGVNYLHEKINEHFGTGENFGIKITYNVEEHFMGTGGALKDAQDLLSGGRFIMLNGDNMMDIDYAGMLEVHERNNATGTLALIELEKPRDFGLVDVDAANPERITAFREKPEEEIGKGLINVGAYILEQDVFSILPQGECAIERTAFPDLATEGKLFGYLHRRQWFATDDLERYNKACGEWQC